MKVINRNRKGEIIEDLSKVKLPIELQKEIFEILNPNRKAV